MSGTSSRSPELCFHIFVLLSLPTGHYVFVRVGEGVAAAMADGTEQHHVHLLLAQFEY